VKLIGAALPWFTNERVQIPPDQDGLENGQLEAAHFGLCSRSQKRGVTQVYNILCPCRSRYMFGLLWIVEERIFRLL
jgi:hypothetical protein